MNIPIFPQELRNISLYFVGIKGTGMAALAELLFRQDARITGSDTEEKFYTDSVLRGLGIPFFEGFDAAQVPRDARAVVYSAAYSPDKHPELLRAKELGIPLFSYPEALGAFSQRLPSAGIAGVHGKTSTAALVGTLIRELGLPGSVLAGSAVSSFDGYSTWVGGQTFFVAETCEYRRHFLFFHPRWIVLTSVELDHPDYFKDYEDIHSAFVEYCRNLSPGGTLVYCADDPGACKVMEDCSRERRDLRYIPYGRRAEGSYRITSLEEKPGATVFRLSGIDRDFEARVPGLHTVLNSAAAIALVQTIQTDLTADNSSPKAEPSPIPGAPLSSWPPLSPEALVRGIVSFRGSKRRSECLGEAGGILFADDYAHHPTAIKTTLKGFRRFYPERRIVADFMSHTYSRTAALLEDFAASFSDADILVLHKIYASAREINSKGISGKDLFEKTRKHHPRVVYFEEVMDAAAYFCKELKAGDLFITLGAGDNWRLGRRLFDEIKETIP
jgi:UDP-N-acetylmuramate--alanine ligase